MKTIYKYIMCAFASLLVLASCDKNDDCGLDLNGNCLIEQIALDNFEGNVDLASRSIVVRVPETAVTNAMKVTSMKISDGAKADVTSGQTLNMDNAQNIHVTNGDLYMDWSLSVLRDEAHILSFTLNDLYHGIIDEENKTITVYVSGKFDINNATATIEVSPNAEVTPGSGVTQNFSKPVVYTVKNNTAESQYTVNVVAIDKPKAIFVGAASDMSKLDPEARTACEWLLGNAEKAMYVSFADIKAKTVDLADVELVWWHFHFDGGVDGHDPFMTKAPEALDVKNEFRDMYERGVNMLFTRYATIFPSFFGVTGDDEWTTPNNCWGGNEDNAEICGGPWDFRKADPTHPIFANTVAGSDANCIYLTDKGYAVTNSTAQYHIKQHPEDWGDYENDQAWMNRTGAKILGKGGDGAIVAWEYPAHDGKGGIICIGSGCYDWYSISKDYEENFHKNVAIMTKNAINYLTK
ncbi:MAG: DUF4960 domain-containing protein [Prevotella sp.]|nr:DUF4960 domain-containing protein [Prevotella sp.]